jgi:hypothetical protein
MKNILLLLIGTLCLTSCKPKPEDAPVEIGNTLTIESTLSNGGQVQGSLNTMGFFVEPSYAGTLKQNGRFTLNLPDNFDTITQEAFNTYNKEDSAAYKLQMNTVKELFTNLDGLDTTGILNPIALAGTYYGFQVFENGQRNGAIYPTSSPAFMTYILEQQREGAVAGYYYFFVYASAAAQIKGITSFNEYLDNDSDKTFKYLEEHDIVLNPGWNIVKYEILKAIETSYGTTIPAYVKKSSVNKLDGNTSWFHITGTSQAL